MAEKYQGRARTLKAGVGLIRGRNNMDWGHDPSLIFLLDTGIRVIKFTASTHGRAAIFLVFQT